MLSLTPNSNININPDSNPNLITILNSNPNLILFNLTPTLTPSLKLSPT